MRKNLSALLLMGAIGMSLFSGCSQSAGEETAAAAPVQGEGMTAASSAQEESTAAPAATSHSGSYTYADTIAWDGQYDVVVVGFGGAGAVAASTAADEGADVLLLEKAPDGHEGGNTRYCGQLFVYGGEDEEATYNYYKALAGGRDIPEDMLQIYTKNIAHMYDFVENLTGIPKEGYFDWSDDPFAGAMSPEYPELPGAEKISLNTLHALPYPYSDGFLWKTLRGMVTDRADKIDVWFESPATHLIQDPDTKTIIGIQAERGGKTLNIRALNGVVMACGGFENNPEMVSDYLGLGQSRAVGTLYNTGDGVRMVQEVGADLWHMDTYEGGNGFGGVGIMIPEDEHIAGRPTLAANGAVILVSGDGSRYVREDEADRHGHVRVGDAWVNIRQPLKSYIICTAEVYDAAQDSGFPQSAVNIQNASNIKELAQMIGADPEVLSATVERFNGYAKNGYDPEFGRAADSMKPFSGDSFYAIETCPAILNTQGGGRRNVDAAILDTNGNPIPHLYSAGEFGGICAFQYQGGGNMAECMIFGQIAGKNAAAPKADLPACETRQQIVSSLIYTPGTESDLAPKGPDVNLSEGEYLGVSHNGMGGDLYVKVSMDGDKIADVEIVDHHETDGISDPAREQLPEAIVSAGSTEVDNISGATITSKAIKEAVEDALSQVK